MVARSSWFQTLEGCRCYNIPFLHQSSYHTHFICTSLATAEMALEFVAASILKIGLDGLWASCAPTTEKTDRPLAPSQYAPNQSLVFWVPRNRPVLRAAMRPAF